MDSMKEYRRVERWMQLPNSIFVFGSNEQGIHKSGAAKDAMEKYGAIYGEGEGWQGESYAIPTKSDPWTTLPLQVIEGYVEIFAWFTDMNPHLDFVVTKVGCGLARIPEARMREIFQQYNRPNMWLPLGWE